MSFQDGSMFGGRIRPKPGATKIRVTDPAELTLERIIHGRRDLVENDDQFTVAIGNLLVMSDDQLSPETQPVRRNRDRCARHARRTRLHPWSKPSFLETVPPGRRSPLASASPSPTTSSSPPSIRETFIVRPLGGSALEGTFSVTMSVLNFEPAENFEPQTTYEVVLPAGGIKDYVGNGVAEEFRSTFSTR